MLKTYQTSLPSPAGPWGSPGSLDTCTVSRAGGRDEVAMNQKPVISPVPVALPGSLDTFQASSRGGRELETVMREVTKDELMAAMNPQNVHPWPVGEKYPYVVEWRRPSGQLVAKEVPEIGAYPHLYTMRCYLVEVAS
jgi:hypothetical protein